MKKLLFLCTGNACRSQMAEGWSRTLLKDAIDVYSAGIVARGLDARAVQAMREKQIDIACQHSKSIEELPAVAFDLVITLCGDAAETCPYFSGARIVHHGFDDPPRLALQAADEKEALDCYRSVRDDIAAFIATLPDRYPELFAQTGERRDPPIS